MNQVCDEWLLEPSDWPSILGLATLRATFNQPFNFAEGKSTMQVKKITEKEIMPQNLEKIMVDIWDCK